jgi:hypothetical protein
VEDFPAFSEIHSLGHVRKVQKVDLFSCLCATMGLMLRIPDLNPVFLMNSDWRPMEKK